MVSSFKTLSLLSSFLLAGITSVSAHGYIVSWEIDGESKPGYQPSYPPALGPTAERPTDNRDHGYADHYSPIVACGGMSAGENVQTWDVRAGATIKANWDSWDWGHRGPVMEYMAACPSSGCDGVDAASLQWFKISQAGWDGKEFASETITRTNSWSFNIPSELAAGPYLIRHEIIAMHDPDDPQVYPVCFQANLLSDGNVRPADTVTFPAAYSINEDFKSFNLYYGSDFNAFTPPGPAVYSRSGGSVPAPQDPAAPSSAPAASSDNAPAPTTSLITSGAHATGSGSGSGSGSGGHCRRKNSRRQVLKRYSKRALPSF